MNKPIIGIVAGVTPNSYMGKEITSFYVFNDYNTAVLKFGGAPICIMPTKSIDYLKTKKEDIAPLSDEEKDNLISTLKLCDGVIMPGGTRSFEHNYFIDNYLKENNIPTLGICLGMQIMCMNSSKEKLGDIEAENHYRKTHDIKLEEGKLKSIINKDVIDVNSYHNHMVISSGDYKVVARSSDGVIEAVEDSGALFRVGVQWHPEKDIENENNKKIFEAFIDAAIKYKKVFK